MRKLIINCDDFGQSCATNKAIIDLLKSKKVSSTTLMTCTKAFEDDYTDLIKIECNSIGLHVTLTSEWESLRWKSITKKNSLNDKNGFFPKSTSQLWEKATCEDIMDEIVAQYEKAVNLGFSLTHLDNHMFSLFHNKVTEVILSKVLIFCASNRLGFRIMKYKRPDNFIYLAKRFFRYTIPFWSNSWRESYTVRNNLIKMSNSLNVPHPDYVIDYPFEVIIGEDYFSFKKMIIKKIRNLPKGISELYIHPAIENEEIKKFNPHWQKRVWEYKFFLETDIVKLLHDEGIKLISYKDILNVVV